jgi:hypothetical protein
LLFINIFSDKLYPTIKIPFLKEEIFCFIRLLEKEVDKLILLFISELWGIIPYYKFVQKKYNFLKTANEHDISLPHLTSFGQYIKRNSTFFNDFYLLHIILPQFEIISISKTTNHEIIKGFSYLRKKNNNPK